MPGNSGVDTVGFAAVDGGAGAAFLTPKRRSKYVSFMSVMTQPLAWFMWNAQWMSAACLLKPKYRNLD